MAVAGFKAFPPLELPSVAESFLLLPPLALDLESFLLSLVEVLLSLLTLALGGMMTGVDGCCSSVESRGEQNNSDTI